MKTDKRFTQHAKKVAQITSEQLGYTRPELTHNEWALKNKWEAYRRWTPTTRYSSGNPDEPLFTLPQPENPKMTKRLLEKIEKIDKWERLYVINFDKGIKENKEGGYTLL
jgi:hypothetical protein